jgi:two-component system copper resistance phosphate regulon response regulator CusR
MSFQLLMVEDDDEIAEFVGLGLREEGFSFERAADGHEGERRMLATHWDLIILDWSLPGPDGLSLVRKLRASNQTTPILFLTARDAVQDRVQGLRAGADDYLCKPFAFEELLARVDALIRRNKTQSEIRYQDIVVDVALNRCQRAGSTLHLTAREQSLLVFFIRHAGETLTRAQLYEQVWQDDYDGLSNTLEVHVMELRRKLEVHGPRLLHTVRGRGYMFGDPSAGS